jgi:hypothetical protein
MAKAEAAGEIFAVSSLAKNKLDFSGRAAAKQQPQHIRFDEQGQAEGGAAAAGQAAAEGDAAAAAAKASNKSAAQLLRERLMKGGGSSSNAAATDAPAGAVKAEPAAAADASVEAADGTASPPAAAGANGAAVNGAAAAAAAAASGEEGSATPGEPSPKRARTAEPPEAGDGEMEDAIAAATAAVVKEDEVREYCNFNARFGAELLSGMCVVCWLHLSELL